jgi:thiosulfate/3-mercaptopyruvate sulfurtransferase
MAEGPLVDATWLQRAMREPGLVIADVRWRPYGNAREAFAAGHILGAVLVDVQRDLAAPAYDGPGRHPLPPPDRFAERMGALGIRTGDTVVAYDDAAGSLASRLWWMLRVTGHRAFVLDGGLVAWPGHRATGPPPERNRTTFLSRPWPPERIVKADEIADIVARGGSVLDARARERYLGEEEPIDAKAGHIPGARSAPFAESVEPATQRFRSPSDLRARFEELGATGDVVVYCGSGVTSCQLMVAMEAAGIPSPRLYVGSWSDWITDPARPIATGPTP